MMKCKLPECEQQFEPPPDAPHKLFCCASHRSLFHDRRRLELLRSLRDLPVVVDSKVETDL